MKRTIHLLLGLALATTLHAQTIRGYEYWFDQNDAARTFVPAIGASINLPNETLSNTGLSTGPHEIHIRLKDGAAGQTRWSSVTTRHFNNGPGGPHQIVAVRYWLSNDLQPVLNTDLRYKYFTVPVQYLNITNDLDLCGYGPPGANLPLKLQLLDSHGQWSSVMVKLVSIASAGAPNAVQSITPSGPLCPGTNVTFTANHTVVAPNGTPTSFTWTVPSGYTIVSGQGTQAVEVTIGNTPGNMAVSASNYCGDVSASFPVTPILPAVLTNVSGPAIVCEGGAGATYNTQIYSGTYQWTTPAGWSFSPPNPTGNTATALANAGAQSGVIAVLVTNICGVNSNTVTVPVTVDGDALITSISGNSSSGQNGTVTISAVAPNATSFSWDLPAGWAWDESGVDTLDAVANLIASADTGSYLICVTSESGTGCTDTACWTVHIDLNVGVSLHGALAVSAYPNPNNGCFTIDLGPNDKALLILRDPAGRMIKALPVASRISAIDLAELASGTYLLECRFTDRVAEQLRIVIDR